MDHLTACIILSKHEVKNDCHTAGNVLTDYRLREPRHNCSAASSDIGGVDSRRINSAPAASRGKL